MAVAPAAHLEGEQAVRIPEIELQTMLSQCRAGEDGKVPCLFCNRTLESVGALRQHLISKHLRPQHPKEQMQQRGKGPRQSGRKEAAPAQGASTAPGPRVCDFLPGPATQISRKTNHNSKAAIAHGSTSRVAVLPKAPTVDQVVFKENDFPALPTQPKSGAQVAVSQGAQEASTGVKGAEREAGISATHVASSQGTKLSRPPAEAAKKKPENKPETQDTAPKHVRHALQKPAPSQQKKGPRAVTAATQVKRSGLHLGGSKGLGVARRGRGGEGKQAVVNPNPASSVTLLVRRGKERVVPKQKRPSKLKRIILADRAQKAEAAAQKAEAAAQSSLITPALPPVAQPLPVGTQISTSTSAELRADAGNAGNSIDAREGQGDFVTIQDGVSSTEARSTQETSEPNEGTSPSTGSSREAEARSVVPTHVVPESTQDPEHCIEEISEGRGGLDGTANSDAKPGPQQDASTLPGSEANSRCVSPSAGTLDQNTPSKGSAVKRDDSPPTDQVDSSSGEQSLSAATDSPCSTADTYSPSPVSISYIGPGVHIRYCQQVMTQQLNDMAASVLRELLRLQLRAKERDPLKAKMRQRLAMGLRESSRALRVGRARAVVMAPNIEEVGGEGGLEEGVEGVLGLAREKEVPVVFALTKSKMGKVLGRRARMSAVAIVDCDGANEQFKEMLKLAEEGREMWKPQLQDGS